jgi:uncharacterized alpha-E superfamily protein
MLSSTAKNLYWMGRYLQRAKSTARLIEATQRMALQSRGEEAAGVAAIFGMEDEFRQTQQQSSGGLANLIDFLVVDENNPSSIVSSIGAARRNAREERNNITVDVWESLNGLWLELSERLRGDRALLDRGALIESVNPHWLDLAKDWYPWMKECGTGRDASTTPGRSQAAGQPPLSMTGPKKLE